jgi:hypothetical protein
MMKYLCIPEDAIMPRVDILDFALEGGEEDPMETDHGPGCIHGLMSGQVKPWTKKDEAVEEKDVKTSSEDAGVAKSSKKGKGKKGGKKAAVTEEGLKESKKQKEKREALEAEERALKEQEEQEERIRPLIPILHNTYQRSFPLVVEPLEEEKEEEIDVTELDADVMII